MIIPPDPEKDPRLLASVSTSSLAPSLSSSSIYLAELEAAHLGAENLPPYEARRWSRLNTSVATHHEDEGLTERSRPNILIPPTSTPRALSPVSDDSPTPTQSRQPTLGSTSKLWESPYAPRRKRRTFLGVPLLQITVSPQVRKWWKKYRRWVQATLILLMLGVGLVIGLLVGLKVGVLNRKPEPKPPWHDGGGQNFDGGNGSNLNFTYIPSRDDPSPAEGNLTNCQLLLPISLPNPNYTITSASGSGVNHSATTFTFPLSPDLDFAVFARGLAAVGTVEFVGQDSANDILCGGEEGVIRVDVVASYGGSRDLNTIAKTCQMVRNDGGVGVGLYTPCQTDGKSKNPYNVDDETTPLFHVIIRLPESTFSSAIPTRIANFTLGLDSMNVRLGAMRNVEFGNVVMNFENRGGVIAKYVAARDISVATQSSSIRGTWNVSQSLSVNTSSGAIVSDVILFDPSVQDDSSLTSKVWARNAAVHPITTVFSTNNGPILLSYLHQPTSVALSSFVASSSSEINVSLHPNYVGVFGFKNPFGTIFLPPPSSPATFAQGRIRTLIQGEVDIQNGTMLSRAPPLDVTGAVYWENEQAGIGAQNISEIQDESSGEGASQLVVLGGWADMKISFDGT
ncbi:hypothetical protein P7C73_g2737, partial [Tremellales sp. Uapishka_1]